MVKINRIYTRTGDNGTTGLVDGSRTAKHAPRMEAIGAVDEANSAIGLAVCAFAGSAQNTDPNARDLTRIQNDLFDLGADLATPGTDFTPGEMTLRIVPAQAAWLEGRIDALNEHIAPLTSFILPGGSEAAARVHVARAAARRAERAMTALAAQEPVNPAALAYINRLSDYLFVLARAANANGADDVLWVPGQNR
ncbi:MAG: cob(I)yrinic acid a,c-diamide adenosyltransferase [Novosphingobium sp.]|nr:cob(I)yrinic acid a,c-diamide adenosyltransferase [Novosphingobium sp.]